MNNEEIEDLMKNGIVMVDGEPVATAKWIIEQFEKQERETKKVASYNGLLIFLLLTNSILSIIKIWVMAIS